MTETLGQLYGVLDAARDERLLPAMQVWAPEARCLFEGALSDAVARAAPYVVPLPSSSPLLAWWREAGLGHAWGIALRSEGNLVTLRHHLRTLLRVQLPNGQIALFRFWDPRVLRPFLPSCKPAVLRRIFGPISCIYAEGEVGGTVTYLLAPDDQLRTE